ncbi:CppA N-terminal domain-containing protein [Streptococcus caviae]|uniref:CppA N-terminal domain-containing protein n=1 Tax=Streptococcus sp. 'caviae' TaxID=1915004 RepID=UPI00094B7F68|nr:CppA N-terminal domain-containing protein [Streptococcus sp. 'caviae']OLN84597.1 peptidase [Streptococcus sp. 'caviae']
MSLFEQMDFHSPVLRVNDRDKNIDFYQKTLGFRLFSEENALAIFTDWSHSGSRFIIEESPDVRTRAVKGLKKLQKMIIKADKADEIAALLANGAEAVKIFKGAKGYAFEALSPDNDLFLLHAEDDLSTLKEAEEPDIRPQEDFEGLSAYRVEKLILNVPDKGKSQDFYQRLFQNQFPLSVDFVEGLGDDLEIAPHIAWDLEILEVKVTPDYDLAALKVYLEEKGQDVYLDKKEKVLVLSDPSRIEIWFRKLS